MAENYEWKFCSLGGVSRVRMDSGDDIAHIGELDQKLWTALSCPTDGLNIDRKTLEYLDADSDGKIKATEVIAAARWLTSALKDKDAILKGESELSLKNLDTDTELGKRLHSSARVILKNIGKKSDVISIDDTCDSVSIFRQSSLNGDGVVTVSATDDTELQATIADIVSTLGGVIDKSTEKGVDRESVEAFYTKCEQYSAWRKDGQSRAKEIFPFGDDTQAALEACMALDSKISDFFMRCKLINFNADCEPTVDISAESIAKISDLNLSECADQIAQYPLAHPSKNGYLDFDAINPAWESAFRTLRDKVLDASIKGKMNESDWKATLARFDSYKDWKSKAQGCEVEPLGIERVDAILEQNNRQALIDLVASDLALKDNVEAVHDLVKFQYLYRDFYSFLKNFIIFKDLYTPGIHAAFEAGSLYIDQRCCNLCIRVTDMSKHADMAALSGMFLIYCNCVAKAKGKTMDILAVMTNGNTTDLRPGKNGIFYDLDGEVWDATITKIVDNPVSIRQAFWSPYRKFWEFIKNLINKSIAEKEKKTIGGIEEKISKTAESLPTEVAASADAPKDAQKDKSPFDIAKFCGIFAAIGMAIGYIGTFVTKIVAGVMSTPVYKVLLAIVAIMLIISVPSCVMAWFKLRKRDLGPVLNAGGWAINSVVLINVVFGASLTSVAKYPVVLHNNDPFAEKKVPLWKRITSSAIGVVLLLFAILYFTGSLACIGLPR